jgi:hypothetical protein
MTIRRNARWQRRLDERILENLRDEGWSTPDIMEIELPIEATESQIRDRCMVMADAELIAIEPWNNWRCELETRGALYLDGEIDVELYEEPRPPWKLEQAEYVKRWAAIGEGDS